VVVNRVGNHAAAARPPTRLQRLQSQVSDALQTAHEELSPREQKAFFDYLVERVAKEGRRRW
jgi:hypothetical protein